MRVFLMLHLKKEPSWYAARNPFSLKGGGCMELGSEKRDRDRDRDRGRDRERKREEKKKEKVKDQGPDGNTKCFAVSGFW